MTRYNEVVETALAELAKAGVKPNVELGGKHYAITWEVNGRRRRHTAPVSPSDHRSLENNRHQVRQMLREDGLLVSEDDTPAPAPRLFLQAGEAMCTSRDVAEHFGKLHKNVLQSIDTILKEVHPHFGGLNFQPTSYTTVQGKSQRGFNLTRDGFALLVMGFTGADAMQWKVKYIDAFNAMEGQLAQVANRDGATLALPNEVTSRIQYLEDELRALTDLVLEQPKTPDGYILVASHFRKIRKDAKRK